MLSPQANPFGRMRPPGGMPYARLPRIRPQKTREYSKVPPIQGPSQGVGMPSAQGGTQMTGAGNWSVTP